ncbi:MAG: hypothetical protein IT374_11575 [Polyangiaceae bacterium]|nr:hypothetical protein [Polyangiaceae bacterium]
MRRESGNTPKTGLSAGSDDPSRPIRTIRASTSPPSISDTTTVSCAPAAGSAA